MGLLGRFVCQGGILSKSRLDAVALVLGSCTLLMGCGTDPEVEKSISDIRTSVGNIRDEIKLESKAVDAGDARTETESVRLVAQVEAERLQKYASRAPAEIQEFADAAESWAEAVATSRTAILEGAAESTSAAAMLNMRLSEKKMDSEAEELGIEPWLKLDEY